MGWLCTFRASAIVVLLSLATVASGQVPFRVVTAFNRDNQVQPNALIQALDGNFYGTTARGGAFNQGTVFRMTPQGSVTTLHEFTGPQGDGTWPLGLLQATDGDFYGTTLEGGPGCGIVFKITAAGTFTILHTFLGGGDPAGCSPSIPLTQAANGDLYGATNDGSSQGVAFFRISTTGDFRFLAKLSGYAHAPLLAATDGNLYGAIEFAANALVRIRPDDSVEIAYWFMSDLHISSLVQLSAQELLGVSYYGVYRLTLDGSVTPLHMFTGTGGDGYGASVAVRAADGNFYGTTYYGGDSDAFLDGHGTIFRITPDGTVSTFYRFTGGVDGAHPGALVAAADGSLYGTTDDRINHGTIFRLTLDGHLTTVARAFTSNISGSNPRAAVIQGADSNFYGTTAEGGAFNLGTVFQATPDGRLNILHAFNGLDGATPNASLLQDSAGAFLGTTTNGGVANRGTIFRVTSQGALKVLHAFGKREGAHPFAPLVRGADGNYYGTTRDGGAYDSGTVFRLNPAGTVTTLYAFTGGVDGGHPVTALLLAADGNFYGTTSEFGLFNAGTIFRITPNGAFALLHTFSGTDGTGRDGTSPRGALIQAVDTSLYGTTYAGGVFNLGTVFRMTTAGVLTTLHSFVGGSSGQSPSAGLIQASDGNFYGTTTYGGYTNLGSNGTIFRLTTAGVFTTLHALWDNSYSGPPEGREPVAALVQASDGDFYGVASTAGPLGGGTLFHFTYRPDPPGLAAVLTSAGHVRLTWIASARAESYRVKRRGVDGTEVVLASGLTVTSFEDDTVTISRGHAYYYVVEAVNGIGGTDGIEMALHTPVGRRDDYDGDGIADFALYRPSSHVWYIARSGTHPDVAFEWGLDGDIPVPGDYDGDGKTDIAVFRPSTGTWFIWQSSTQTPVAVLFGANGDVPVPADYDGDGVVDFAVFRPSNGTWYVWQSSTGTGVIAPFGNGGDRPVPADYDGDGLTDLAVFRPSSGTWYIWQSSTNQGLAIPFGRVMDEPVPADYDGDGKADLAVVRTGTGVASYLVWLSSTKSPMYRGASDGIPVTGDYDGDGRADFLTFNGGYWQLQDSAGGYRTLLWGTTGDIPLPTRP